MGIKKGSSQGEWLQSSPFLYVQYILRPEAARRRLNHDMVKKGVQEVPTLCNRVVIF